MLLNSRPASENDQLNKFGDRLRDALSRRGMSYAQIEEVIHEVAQSVEELADAFKQIGKRAA